MDTLKHSYNYGTSPLSPDSLSKELRIYLFGKPIAKSLSPLLQPIFFKAASASWTFHLAETTRSTEFSHKLEDPDYIGASITMPNKVAFMPFLDDITEEARTIGAVNTCFVRLDGQGIRRHIGTNTDCIGIRDTLHQKVPKIVQTKLKQPALVIGGGGAARSAIYALWRWFEPSEIYIVNRLKSEVDAIITSFETTIPGINLQHVATVQSAYSLPTPVISIGTIPDYPPKGHGEILCWQICEIFMQERKGVLLDMCYLPSPITRLSRMAEKNGWLVIYGSEVLVRICAAQQVLWLEKEPSIEAVNQAQLVVKASLRDVTQSKL
ncbi:hypothetical protein B7463_g10258, partial [Scytalidium lignicola]